MKPFVLLLFLMLCHVRGQILGGNWANQGDYPYAVQVKHRYWFWQNLAQTWNEHVCGGTIIHDNWVITAAHCVRPDGIVQETSIIAGDIMRHDPQGQNQHRREYNTNLCTVIRHPGYSDYNIEYNLRKHYNLGFKGLYLTQDNLMNIYADYRHHFDIALIHVRNGIQTNAWTQPFGGFVSKIIKPGDECTVMGWGNTAFWGFNQANPSPRLKHLRVTVRQLANEIVFENPADSKVYTSQSIEIDFGRNGERTLEGDSGGPLVCKDPKPVTSIGRPLLRSQEKDAKSRQDGVLYRVLSGTDDDRNMLYVSTTHHLEWIREKMGQKEKLRQDVEQQQQQANENRERNLRIVTGLTGLMGGTYLFAYRR